MHGNMARTQKGNPRKPLRFKWNSVTIKILGYTYEHSKIETREENWEKIGKISGSLYRSADI